METPKKFDGEIDQTLRQIVSYQGFDLDTALGQKVLICLAEVFKAVPDGYQTDLCFEPIQHEAGCACIRGGACDCDPDVSIRLEGLRPVDSDALGRIGATVH